MDVDSQPGHDNPRDFGTDGQYPVLRYDCPCRDD